jgi:hypothetical protein
MGAFCIFNLETNGCRISRVGGVSLRGGNLSWLFEARSCARTEANGHR